MKREWEEILPPEGHPRLGRELLDVVTRVISDKQQLGLHEKWLRQYRLVRGSHWEKTDTKIPLKMASFTYTHMQRTVNTLTDNNPTFNVTQAGDAEDGDIYATLELTAEHWWAEQEQQSVLERSIRNGETYGSTIEKIIFNPDLEIGMGEVETVVIDPFHFGVYPVKCTDIQKADILLHYYPMRVREAQRRWPEAADKIRGDSQFLEDLGDERREIAAGVGGDNKYNQILARMGSIVTSLFDKDEKAQGEEETLVVEAWIKDYTPDKYRGFIRRVTACAAGLVVVDDRSNPSISDALPDELAVKTFLYDKFPFILANSVVDTGSLWGQADIEQLENLQTEINKTISQIAYHKDRAVRPKIINPRDSGVPNEHFTNVAGIINPASGMVAANIRELTTTNNLKDMLDTFNLYKELFFTVGGTFELDQAQAPGKNVIAYKAIATLLERAETMMRGKIRNYSRLIRDRGRMYLSHVMNFYTEDRWITYEIQGETHTMSIRGTNMIVPNRLTVVSGSTMPRSKIQQREEALQLFQQQAIDREDLLEKIDWSGRAAVIRRMESGPLDDFLNRMEQMGVDPEMIAMLNEIGMMERKHFDQGLLEGEIPMLDLPQTHPKVTTAIEEKMAETERLRSESELTLAKIEEIKANIMIGHEKNMIEREKIRSQAQLQAQAQDAKQEVPKKESK